MTFHNPEMPNHSNGQMFLFLATGTSSGGLLIHQRRILAAQEGRVGGFGGLLIHLAERLLVKQQTFPEGAA
jgi:hypothetical protein